MSDQPSFVAALRELDETRQAERLRPGAVHRITRRLDAELLQTELPKKRRGFIPMVSFAAGAATVLAVFTLSSGPDAVLEETTDAPAPMHASWEVSGSNCHTTNGKTELTLDGSCHVVVPGADLVVESRKTTRLRGIENGVAMIDGTALFDITPDIQGPPRRVVVPGGTIEVHGTRFSVVVRYGAGHVDLLEGSVHFIDDAGKTHELSPGQRFMFSANETIAAAPSPTPTSTGGIVEPEVAAETEEAPALPLAAGERLAALANEYKDKHSRPARSRAPSSEELQGIVQQIAEFRAQRKYDAAVSLLRGALNKRWDRRTREVLSYELGTILSNQLTNREQACAHWQNHRRQFPSGQYARAIERVEARLTCEK
ncbi:MAG: FecR domain-containing protein [Myxococcota bacterium]